MLTASAISQKKWKKKIFLSLFARSNISKKIIFHATCRQEEEDIKVYFGQQVQVYLIEEIPNIYRNWNKRHKQPNQLNCVFISRIHLIKNLLYAINIVGKTPGCSVLFDIYGPIEDQKYFNKCKEAASLADPHIQINFKGPIAHANIFNVLQNYHVFFLPTQGENFGHVIFEALSSGCVLLISDKTPWTDLKEKNAGWALPLNDNRPFADKLRQLCSMNEEQYNEKSKAAFQYAEDYLSKTNLKSRYLSLFQSTE